jgi:hypothetical protein
VALKKELAVSTDQSKWEDQIRGIVELVLILMNGKNQDGSRAGEFSFRR